MFQRRAFLQRAAVAPLLLACHLPMRNGFLHRTSRFRRVTSIQAIPSAIGRNCAASGCSLPIIST